MFECVYWSEPWAVDIDRERRVVRLVRSPLPMDSAAEVRRSFEAMRDALAGHLVDDWGLVFDMRAAKPSQDETIEEAFRSSRKRFKARYGRMSILCASAAGVLQITRMIKQAPDDSIRVFNVEEEAMAWAADGVG